MESNSPTPTRQMLAVSGPSYAISRSHAKVALQSIGKHSQLARELHLANTSRMLRQKAMQDLQQQLTSKDEDIIHLKQQLQKQQFICEQQRRLLERESQSDITEVHIICLKEQLSGLQQQLEVQQQINEDQQRQLQECLQDKMQLSADNAHLKAELQVLRTTYSSKHRAQPAYDSLLQPTWFLPQPADPPCCCGAAVVGSKLASSESAAEATAVQTSAAGAAAHVDLEPADSVDLPDTPTIAEQAYRTASNSSSSSSSDDCSNDAIVYSAADSSVNSSSSIFSCWWPTATLSASSSSSGLISMDSPPSSWWPSPAATASAPAASDSSCSSTSNSEGDTITSWWSSLTAAAVATAAAVTSQAADEGDKSCWWPSMSAYTADLAAAAATTDALYI